MSSLEKVIFKQPTLEDGMAVFRLIQSCPPLDTNSSYCNLLQASHFADTSIAAEIDGELVGFISGYILPARPNTLFVWQVAVAEQARGLGLASRMLQGILGRSQCKDVSYLETTITEDNLASWALFKNLAKKISADFQSSEWMDKTTHFDDQHDSEALVRIGPITHSAIKRQGK